MSLKLCLAGYSVVSSGVVSLLCHKSSHGQVRPRLSS